MFTRGRFVPRQPRAIKGTTRTELRGEHICNRGKFHWEFTTTPVALRGEVIVMLISLIIKRKMISVILSREMTQITA